MSSEGSGVGRAWGWVDHLDRGGTTAWCDWHRDGEPRGQLLPGAQHLEVVRRLNLIEPVSAQLVATVLATSGSGRGQQDLDLVGAVDPGGFGTLPVDPADVPAGELLRVASGALADLALAAPARSAPATPPLRRLRRHRYQLDGDPLVAAAYRQQLRAQGRPPGGRNPRVVVVLTDYATYLADVWAAQARRGNGPPWHRWVGRFAGQDLLPRRVDVLALTEAWAARVGRGRVHPVFDAAAVTRLVGGEPLHPPGRLSHAALEVVRETSVALRVLVAADGRRQLLARTVVPWLAEVDDRDLPGPVVPPRHHGWLTREAVRLRDSMSAAGYPVPRDSLDRLLPGEPARTTGPDQGEVLGVMLKALHRGALAQGAHTEGDGS